MTVSSDIDRSGPYIGNGVTTTFNYGFRILNAAHLSVIKTTVSGVQSALILNSDYTVSGVGDEIGGYIVTATAPFPGETITIVRNVPFVQETDLENQGAYYAQTIENALDLSVMRDQQLAEELSRAFKMPVDNDPSNLEAFFISLQALAKRLLVPRATDPTTRDDGSALQSGDRYFNTVSEIERIYSDGGWHDAGTAMANMVVDSFVCDGVQTAFVLSIDPGIVTNVIVWVGGVRQRPTTDYTVSGTTLNVLTAPAAGMSIDTLVIATVGAVTVIGDGSVTEPKLAVGAVSNISVRTPATPADGIDSAKLKFLPVGTGVTCRSVQDKLRDVVHAKDFGVKADGVADDTVALQAAMSNSRVLILPRGTIRVTAQLNVTVQGFTMIGEGYHETIVYHANSHFTTINVNGIHNVTFRDFLVDKANVYGNAISFANSERPSLIRMGARNVPSGASLIGFDTCNHCLVQDSFLYNCGGHAVVISTSGQSRVIGCKMESIAWAGVNAGAVNGLTVANNTVWGTNDASGYAGIRIGNNSTTCVVTGNVMVNCSRGIAFGGTSFSTFTGNLMNQTTYQAVLAGVNDVGPNQNCNNNVFVGNIMMNAWATPGTNQYALHLSTNGAPGMSCNNNEIAANNVIDTRGPQHTTVAFVDDSGGTNFFDLNRKNTAA